MSEWMKIKSERDLMDSTSKQAFIGGMAGRGSTIRGYLFGKHIFSHI